MKTATYTVITKITHTQEKISFIQGYIGSGTEEYDRRIPRHFNTNVVWIASPDLIRRRLQDFFDAEDLAISKEIAEWKDQYQEKLKNMKGFVSVEEYNSFISNVENFITVSFIIESNRE